MGLVGRSARDKKEYVSAKVNEAYLSGITLGMEAWGERLKALAAESEAVASLVREMQLDCAASPEFWKTGVGADFTLHSRGTLLRLQVEREDPPGTWDKMEARAMDQPMLSSCGAREREEARKLVLKETKPPQQPRAQNGSGKTSGGTSGKGAGGGERASQSTRRSGEIKCFACQKMGHLFFHDKCDEGRKWVAERKANGKWKS